MIILKSIFIKLFLFLDSIFHYNAGQSRILENLVRLFCTKNKCVKDIAIEIL
jgi:hypothetical protein